MSQTKPVEWFTDDPKPNVFFYHSPFRSWKFIVNSVLLSANVVAIALIAWKYWGQISGSLFSIFTFLVLSVVYPYWWAIIRHRKIYELYCSGQLKPEPAGSPVDRILSIADDSMNEGLRNTSSIFLLLLLVTVLFKLEHLK